MVVRLRKSGTSRAVVAFLLALFVVFGATFIPTTIHYSAPEAPVTTSTLRGAEAAAYLQARTAKDAKLRAAMERLRDKPGVHLEGQIVHVTQKQASRPTAMTFLGLLVGPFTAFAEPITEYVEGGVVVFTPFEDDANNDSAEFNVYSHEAETGYGQSADVKVWTHEAAYGDPDAAVEVWNMSLECEGQPSAIASVVSWFAPGLQAQNSYQGESCANNQAQAGLFWSDMKEAIKNGIIAAGAAAGPCVFSNVAWLACVGSAFLGAAAATVGYQAADFIWSCRCPLFGWHCGDEEEPVFL
jgi:hypothetical protein